MPALNSPSPDALPTLTYSHHAIERALSRKLPMLSFLPPEARIADRDSGGTVYKVNDGDKCFYLILSVDNIVITTFSKKDTAEWKRWMQARQKRRGREMRGLIEVFASVDEPHRDALEAEYMACRILKAAFSGGWQERFDTRRARRFSCPTPRQVRAEQMRLLREATKEGIMAAPQVN